MQEGRRRLQTERLEALQEKETRQRRERIEHLISALDEPENHEFAIFQLDQLGDEAVEALSEALLNDDDPDARYGSAIALGRICAEHDLRVLNKAKATQALLKALDDPEPAVRFWTAEALGKFKSPLTHEPLTALLKDSHQGVRQQARRSLNKLAGKT
jgi:HEAT repeat protein